VEQAAAAAESLEDQSKTMAQLVSTFKISEEAASLSMSANARDHGLPRAVTSGEGRPRAKVQSLAGRSRKVVPSSVHSSARPATALTGSEEWTEF